MQWRPDKCASRNSSVLGEAKQKFQKIQEAYSDRRKRVMYDAWIYDPEDVEGFADFLQEMASLVSDARKEQQQNEEEAAVYSADPTVPTPSTAVAASSTWSRRWTLRRERERRGEGPTGHHRHPGHPAGADLEPCIACSTTPPSRQQLRLLRCCHRGRRALHMSTLAQFDSYTLLLYLYLPL
ncbi:Chaperone DnaJ-domain superfamily protein [Striga hermonthica]|uniref:Chaperone DnaJ-domain superfamily protein n=1 Tax=Striga hermonthica TaxID=68872 RepID=A0A9N7N0Q7_STRHE|nr:Chaperone DnaJ-domain superfamily protein [Striga hermonthica]